MVPEWKPKTFFKDGKLSPDDIRDHFPELDIGIHICTFHMFSLDLPLALGKYPVFEAIKTDLYGMKNARDTDDFESRWTQFKVKSVISNSISQPLLMPEFFELRYENVFNGHIVAYVTRWYDMKEMWAKCFAQKFLTLGIETSSPVESTHSVFKSWLLSFFGDLFSLIESRFIYIFGDSILL
jgi:hypothetical protein